MDWNARGCRVIQVIECVTIEGKGEPNDPVREVKWYYDMEGDFLAKYDPMIPVFVEKE